MIASEKTQKVILTVTFLALRPCNRDARMKTTKTIMIDRQNDNSWDKWPYDYFSFDYALRVEIQLSHHQNR